MNFIVTYHFYLKEKNFFENLVTNVCQKTEYVFHLKKLKQTLILKKIHRVINFNQDE